MVEEWSEKWVGVDWRVQWALRLQRSATVRESGRDSHAGGGQQMAAAEASIPNDGGDFLVDAAATKKQSESGGRVRHKDVL
jgi:hypothetical protein